MPPEAQPPGSEYKPLWATPGGTSQPGGVRAMSQGVLAPGGLPRNGSPLVGGPTREYPHYFRKLH